MAVVIRSIWMSGRSTTSPPGKELTNERSNDVDGYDFAGSFRIRVASYKDKRNRYSMNFVIRQLKSRTISRRQGERVERYYINYMEFSRRTVATRLAVEIVSDIYIHIYKHTHIQDALRGFGAAGGRSTCTPVTNYRVVRRCNGNCTIIVPVEIFWSDRLMCE